VLPEGSVNCIITDPPFGVDAISNQARTEEGKKYARKIANDETPEQALAVFSEVMDVLLPKTTPDADMYIFTAWSVLDSWLPYVKSLEASHGFVYKNLLIWEKNGSSMGDLNSWGTSYEVIFFLKKGKRERTDKRRPGVITVGQIPAHKLIHPHEKPTQLLDILLKHSTSKGDLVIDPFGGSGSLVRAARELERDAIAIEYDEENYAKAVLSLELSASLFVELAQ
jgi:site-specific DNA-methyltransferase (adenine-specific)/modification methylase